MLDKLIFSYWQWRKRWHQGEAEYWLALYDKAPELARHHEHEAIRAGFKAQQFRITPKREKYG